jgi:hypothetical protein
MRRPVLAGVAAGCAVVALVVLVGTGLGWWTSASSSPPPALPLAVRTAVTPAAILFGDPVTAQVSVDLDPAAVAAGSVRVEPGFEPFVVAAPPTISRAWSGREETLRYTYALQCTTDACLPTKAATPIRLPPVVVTAEVGGRPTSLTQAWPAVAVASRLQQTKTASAGSDFAVAPLPPPTFAVAPTTLADVLVLLAVLLAAGSSVLLWRELGAALRRRERRDERTRLEAAVAYVRDAAGRREAGDRRKALELLAEALAEDGQPGLAESAQRLAWAEPPPTPAGTLELAEAAEGEPAHP